MVEIGIDISDVLRINDKVRKEQSERERGREREREREREKRGFSSKAFPVCALLIYSGCVTTCVCVPLGLIDIPPPRQSVSKSDDPE